MNSTHSSWEETSEFHTSQFWITSIYIFLCALFLIKIETADVNNSNDNTPYMVVNNIDQVLR